MEFTWDPNKAEINQKKHGVTFEEAVTAFNDPYAMIMEDPEHSQNEERFLILGLSEKYRVLVVVFVERVRDQLRIISARLATAHERRLYETSTYR
jgi:uncharacterized DUF497 family protein